MSIEAMKQALEALEYCKHLAEGQRVWGGTEWSYPFPWKRIFDSTTKSLHTIRTAIEQAEKQAEPFGYFQYDIKLDAWVKSKTNNGIAFYTTPPTGQPQDIKSGIETVAAKGGLLPQQESVVNYCRECLTYNGHQLDVAGHASTATITKWSYRDSGSEGWFIAETVAAKGGLLPQQEPVTQCSYPRCQTSTGGIGDCSGVCSEIIRTTPPAAQREWVGLTDEEIGDLKGGYQSGRIGSFVELTQTIEAKLKEKNA